ncbi:MAG: S9 family peptidase [Janthinobacterium lividum]
MSLFNSLSNPTADLWKERLRTPVTGGAQIAALAPERGIVVKSHNGMPQIHAWEVNSNQFRPLTDKPSGVTFGLLSPDGRFVYYMDDTKGSEIGQYVRGSFDGGPPESVTPGMPPYSASTIPFPQPSLAFSASGNAFLFRFNNSDGYNLCRLDIAPDGALGTPKLLYVSKSLFRAPLLSEDGKIAVVAASERTQKQQYHLFAPDTDGHLLRELADGPESSLEPVAFSPIPGDTRLAASSDRTGVRQPFLWDAATGEVTDLPLPGVEGDIAPLNWSPDGKKLLLCQTHQAAQRLYLYELATNTITRLNHPAGAFPIFGSLGVEFVQEGRAIWAEWGSAEHPTHLIALDGTTGEYLRDVLPPADLPPGRPVQSVQFASSDGILVQGWLCVPEGDGPFPAVISVHGGPHAVVTEAFGMGSLWAENGFAWLTVNFRGSTTFGREFLQKIWGDAGHWELEDMAAARQYLVDKKIAVPEQVFVTGGSYGGYLTLLALGKLPDLWAGGIALVAIADWASTWEDSSGLLQGIQTASFGGTPAEKPELYRSVSPITYAEAVQAPLLVIQGKNDTRCPPRQMEVFEAKMRELGKEIEVIWFDAGHGSGDTEQVIGWYDKVLAFAKKIASTPGV